MTIQEFFRIGMDRVVPELIEPSGPQINLGIGLKAMPKGVESVGLPEWNAETDPLPFPANSIGTIWALHFLEHINNAVQLLEECNRILRPGGVLNVTVPYGVCHMAVQDLTHVHFFNEDTWRKLFDNPYYRDNAGHGWSVHANFIMAVTGENLALFAQLVKKEEKS